MQAFNTFDGLVAPMDRENVDTDLIIPKQFLKSIRKTGFGVNLFDELRYLDEGLPDADNSNRLLNPDFPLNFPRYRGASILLARENFGCGSSREHAAWAMQDYGFRCVIATSFADIFCSNAVKNGILPAVVSSDLVDIFFAEQSLKEGYRLTVDLVSCKIVRPSGEMSDFEIDNSHRDYLLNGLDDIDITLQSAGKIRAFEKSHRKRFPWLFQDIQF